MSGRPAVLLALAAAAFAVTGCTAAESPAAPAADATAGPGPACSAEPRPTASWMGGWATSLPDEIRCLPYVDHGDYSHNPPGAAVASDANAVTVVVVPGTTRQQTLALCHRITDLGYGLDGPHQVALLSVGGGTGHYMSMPGQAPCFEVR
ncbi:hypothetical protein ACFV4P_18740 [Kitasatospora sp. NPDC059795]|uniref:hypothetical protein n=1 Tax=Kitasatospora sp. NPDC059795 TaxID=3346949 RepID=UPI0036542341